MGICHNSGLLTNAIQIMFTIVERKWALLQDKTYYLQSSPNFSMNIYKLDSDLNETFFETKFLSLE